MTQYILLKDPDSVIQDLNQKTGELETIKLDNNVKGKPYNDFETWRSNVNQMLQDSFFGGTISSTFLAESEFSQNQVSETDSIQKLNDALDKSKIYLEQLNNNIKMGEYRPIEQAPGT